MSNGLNITTTNFGNDSEKFFLYSPALYVDRHGTDCWAWGIYRRVELKACRCMFKRDSQTEVKLNRRSVSVLMQIQPETMALVTQRRFDDSDEEFDRVIMGSVAPSPIYPSVVLIGQMVSGEELRLYIRRLQITQEDLEIKLGGDDYSNLPFSGTAQVDDAPLTTNPDWPYNSTYGTQDNIAFWAWPKSFSSTS